MAQRLASVTQQLEMERTKTQQDGQNESTKAKQLELQVSLATRKSHACRHCLTCCR